MGEYHAYVGDVYVHQRYINGARMLFDVMQFLFLQLRNSCVWLYVAVRDGSSRVQDLTVRAIYRLR